MKNLALMVSAVLVLISFDCALSIAQTNIIATDTMRINGQNGNVRLVTGAMERTLNFPPTSGTLALVNDQQGGGCCNADSSAVFYYRWDNATNEAYTSATIDVGRLGKELILTVSVVYPANLANKYGEVRLETTPSLDTPFWWPVVRYTHPIAFGVSMYSWTIRPQAGADKKAHPVTDPYDGINDTVFMIGWMKYIRVVAELGGGQVGRQVLIGLTVR